jgi:hypothetical protein
MPRPRALLFAAPALSIALLVAGCNSAKPKAAAHRTTTTTSTSTTIPASTTAPPPPPAVAPLTGVPSTPDQAANLARPALAVKMDNSTDALPQTGVNNTDIVLEIQVEGISRLMNVFQSGDATRLGPTRSARYSDPPLLAMFGRPLFGWSGANKGVQKAVYGANWIVNVNWDTLQDAYKRSSDRKAPHNLYTNTQVLFSHAQPGEGPPPQQFQYLGAGETNASAVPAPGLNEAVGTTPSTWVWDATNHVYKRWEYGKPHETTDNGQVESTNVVVLATQYSPGPVAISTGSGAAIVLTGGTAITGTWTRADQTKPYTLTAADGTPIKLNPGRTWIELPNHPWGLIDAGTAAGLLAGAK